MDAYDLLRKNDPKKYDRRFNFYKHFKVLILDDWMLTKISDTQATILFSLIRDRDQLATTIVCSQIRPDGWRKQIGPVALADAITRRIVDTGYLIYIDGSSAKSVC